MIKRENSILENGESGIRRQSNDHNILWYIRLLEPGYCCYLAGIMLSKTELLPAKDRLREADRHLAYVKGSLRHIKRVEDKQIVNDLVGAIDAQRKAVEQMLQVLDTVARSDFRPTQVQGLNGSTSYSNGTRVERPRRLQGELSDSAQFYLDVSTDETPWSAKPVNHKRRSPNGKTAKADRS
jgi:murein L,D-transpeptidase YcbB/YkuD